MTSQIKTVMLLGLLSAIIIILGGMLGGRSGVIIAFGLALAMNLGSYWYSDKIVLSMYHARELSPDESPFLHRIVEVRPNDYVLLGDNYISREYGVKDSDILGVMTSFVRNGKELRVDEPAYRAYTAFVINSAPLRIIGKKILGKAKRLLHEI